MVKWRALCWKLCRNLSSRVVGVVIRNLHYEQGQSTKEYPREYFYFIDHKGMLFLDDSRMKNFTSCFKGRVYHQAPERAGGVGLIRSLLAIELSKHFTFADDSDKSPPTHFDWDGTRYKLSNSLLPVINKVSRWNGTE
ncbi:hypothetical protein MRX96_008807 [Rhipicephalus microplus]